MKLFSPFRRVTQIFGLLMANLHVAAIYTSQIYQGFFKGTCLPFLYCHSCPAASFACPLGIMQHYAAIHSFPFLLVGEIILVGMLVGRSVCGWICPVGLVQDYVYKIKSVKIKIPSGYSILPFVMVIVFIIILPYITTEHWFSKICPVGTLVAGIPWVLWNPINPSTGVLTVVPGTVGWLFILKLVILVAVIWLMIVSKRPFCKYMCPMGLFWSFFNKVSVMKLEVGTGCTHCDACQAKCPKDIKIYEDPDSPECIRCLECTACKHVKVVNSMAAKPLESTKLAEI